MARKTETRAIDGLTFEVTQLGGNRCNDLSVRLMGIVAPALGRAGAALGGASLGPGLNGEVDLGSVVSGLGSGLEALVAQLKPTEFKWLSKELCAFARVDAGEGFVPMTDAVIDEHFAGRSGTFLQFMVFAIEVNLQNFGSALAGMFRTAVARAPQSRGTSGTGQAGASSLKE